VTLHTCIKLLIDVENDELLMINEPTNYIEAISDIDYKKWLEAMKSKMDSMYTNQIWTLVDPSEGIKPIRCECVFYRKTDMDGNVQTYDARLVAKGYRQGQGVDFDETFSLIVMLKSIRIVMIMRLDKWMLKLHSQMGISTRMCI